MKKFLKIVGIVVVVLVVVVLITVTFLLNGIVKTGVEQMGPKIMQCPVAVEGVKLSPFTGNGEIRGLAIGNPEGFKTEHSMKVTRFAIAMAPMSVFSDRIRIKEIVIDAPEITYEVGVRGSNIGKITENAEGFSGAGPEEEEPKEKAGKKVQIDRLIVSGGEIRLSSPLLQGAAVPIPLPTIELKDIGKESDGAGLGEVIARVSGAVLDQAKAAVTASGQLVGKGVEALGEAGAKGATAVTGAAKEGVGVVAGAAKDGAGAVGETAAKGVQAVGGAAKEGASKLIGGIKGIVGREEEEK